MQITCKCLNVIIDTKGSSFEDALNPIEDRLKNDGFFKEDVGIVELLGIHKEQSVLVEVHTIGPWLIHRCLSCHTYTHALNSSSNATILVNKGLITNPQEIAALKSSEKYSPVFKILVNPDSDLSTLRPQVNRSVSGSSALHQQLTDWIQRESGLTEERVRAYSDEQYAALEARRTRAHADHRALVRLLSEAAAGPQNSLLSNSIVGGATVSNLSKATEIKSPSPLKSVPFTMPEATAVIPKKPVQVTNKFRVPSKSIGISGRKTSIDAEGLFPLEGMEDQLNDTFHSDEELTDTDDSGSHDEGIHIPRRMGSFTYAKSLPVNVPVFMQPRESEEDPYTRTNEYARSPQDPMDIAASIKALAKSVHGDAVFGDLPRPRFSSQI